MAPNEYVFSESISQSGTGYPAIRRWAKDNTSEEGEQMSPMQRLKLNPGREFRAGFRAARVREKIYQRKYAAVKIHLQADLGHTPIHEEISKRLRESNVAL